jgi:rubrerythrin
MAVSYNAGEILEMAQQIERNGVRFYRRAAQAAQTAHASRILSDLAILEEKHERIFADMAADLRPEERQESLYDPYDESSQYMRAAAGGKVFDLKADPTAWLATTRTMEEVLLKAIGIEKDSIVFYLGLKDCVPERLGRERVEEVIRQEMGHIVVLERLLETA